MRVYAERSTATGRQDAKKYKKLKLSYESIYPERPTTTRRKNAKKYTKLKFS